MAFSRFIITVCPHCGETYILAHLKTTTDYKFEKAPVKSVYQALTNFLQTWEPPLKIKSQEEIQ
jgi:hypothetical protein